MSDPGWAGWVRAVGGRWRAVAIGTTEAECTKALLKESAEAGRHVELLVLRAGLDPSKSSQAAALPASAAPGRKPAGRPRGTPARPGPTTRGEG